jgi:hypothetical protein
LLQFRQERERNRAGMDALDVWRAQSSGQQIGRGVEQFPAPSRLLAGDDLLRATKHLPTEVGLQRQRQQNAVAVRHGHQRSRLSRNRHTIVGSGTIRAPAGLRYYERTKKGIAVMNQTLLAATLTVALGITAARAGTIVNWGGDYVTGNQNYRGTTGTALTGVEWGDDNASNDAVRVWAFSESTPLNPSANYSNLASSAIFYGGVELWLTNSLTAPNTSRLGRVLNNSTTDANQITLDNGTAKRTYAMWAWMKQDFLDTSLTGATVAVTLDATSSFTLDVANNTSNHHWYRFVVKSDDQYYLSSFTQTNDYTLTGTELMNTTWALYSPDLNLQANPGVTSAAAGGASGLLTFDVATSSLTNIQAVGLYAESTTGAAAGNRDFQWAAFSVSAVAIPEPSAIALVGLGMLTLLTLRRRPRS